MPGWDEAFDLVAVGSGIAGCAVTVAGSEAGLETVILEKSPKVGGTTAWSQGILWVGNNHLARGKGLDDSASETRAYLDYLGGGRNDPSITATFVEQAPRALRFFEGLGIPFYAPDTVPDHYYPLGTGSKPWGRSLYLRPFPAQSLGDWQSKLEFTPYGHGRVTVEEMASWGGRAGYRNWDHAVLAERETQDIRTGGAAVAGYFFKTALDHGVAVRTETEVTRLILEDDLVVGVEVQTHEGARRIQARKGVVLASGGHGANARLAHWVDEFASWPPIAAPRNTGDGFILAAEHGAAFTVMHGSLSIQVSFYVPGEVADGQPLARTAGSREVAYPHSILVNQAGQRFADESAFGDVGTKLRHFDFATHKLTNVPCYLVFDRQYLDKYGLGSLAPGSEPPEWLPRADTPGALAEKVGIDPEGLEATILRFNGFVANGVDEDFLRGRMHWSAAAAGDRSQTNPNLGSVSEPPYFALEAPPNVNSIGLVIDEHGQVRHLRGHTIPGLYACGEVVAGAQWVGVGYQAGLTLAPSMTFGWLIAQHAAQRSLIPSASTALSV